MPRFFFSLCVFAMCFGLSPGARAEVVDKEQIKKDYDQWFTETNAEFEKNWAGILAAEADAEPVYAKGIKLAEAGKTKEAIATLLEARAKLFNGPNANYVHVDKGLSHKIAMALATIYEEKENGPRLKQETFFMNVSRPWMTKAKEQQVYMHYAIKELYRVHSEEERKTGKRMKTAERKRLYRIMSYLVHRS